jgi:hypothetical protein
MDNYDIDFDDDLLEGKKGDKKNVIIFSSVFSFRY